MIAPVIYYLWHKTELREFIQFEHYEYNSPDGNILSLLVEKWIIRKTWEHFAICWSFLMLMETKERKYKIENNLGICQTLLYCRPNARNTNDILVRAECVRQRNEVAIILGIIPLLSLRALCFSPRRGCHRHRDFCGTYAWK